MTSINKRPYRRGIFEDPADSSDSEFERLLDNPIEQAFFDKRTIEKELASGTFVIILQTTPSKNSHCRAWNCPPETLSGRPNIRSAFRFNLKDLSGRHYGEFSTAGVLNEIFTGIRTKSILPCYLRGANLYRSDSTGAEWAIEDGRRDYTPRPIRLEDRTLPQSD